MLDDLQSLAHYLAGKRNSVGSMVTEGAIP
jgi:hypothetical protein